MFPELKPYLEEVWEQAAEGTEFVISKHRSMAGKSETGWKAVNLRTQFEKILRRAGLEQWPKLLLRFPKKRRARYLRRLSTKKNGCMRLRAAVQFGQYWT